MRRRRLLLLATALVLVVAAAAGFVVTRTSSKTSDRGPLVTEDTADFSSSYSHLASTDKVTIAALVVTNSGPANITLRRASAVGANNVDVLGTFALDRDRVSPGSYRGFPPKLGGKSISLRRISMLGPLPPGGSLLLATGLQLADGHATGAIRGIRLDYSVNGHVYRSSFPELTELCTGDPDSDPRCKNLLASESARRR